MECAPDLANRPPIANRSSARFVAAQRLNADRPEARSALGNFYTRRGLASDAEAQR